MCQETILSPTSGKYVHAGATSAVKALDMHSCSFCSDTGQNTVLAEKTDISGLPLEKVKLNLTIHVRKLAPSPPVTYSSPYTWMNVQEKSDRRYSFMDGLLVIQKVQALHDFLTLQGRTTWFDNHVDESHQLRQQLIWTKSTSIKSIRESVVKLISCIFNPI